IIGAYEHAFPDRICSYYLIGSYVEHTAVALSDIDCFVIFANDFISLEEQQRAEHIGQQCALESPVRLDIGAYPQNKLDSLYPFIRVALKLGSSLLYGTDIRAMIRIPDLSEYIPSLSAGAQYFIARIRGQTELTAKFVDYPDASDSFFGYTSKSIAAWYPATVDAGTKELVATTSRIAGAIVAYEAQRYIPGKQAAIALFQELGNPWAAFVQDVYYTCKIEWKYLVPQAEQARQQLRKLCQQMLGFENMFLQTYCGTV
ncbi:MAG: hypothetical protein SH847_17060, partial [Roseiflexaceae bacterium]|nr:hypothetical protein [Roseiflexaceae bacterium]